MTLLKKRCRKTHPVSLFWTDRFKVLTGNADDFILVWYIECTHATLQAVTRRNLATKLLSRCHVNDLIKQLLPADKILSHYLKICQFFLSADFTVQSRTCPCMSLFPMRHYNRLCLLTYELANNMPWQTVLFSVHDRMKMKVDSCVV